MVWTGRIRGRRMTAGHAWEQIKFTALDAGEFYQTASVTEEAFLLFSLSVWFLLFLLLRKKKQEKWDKENPNANESSKTISFSETLPFSFSFTMKRRSRFIQNRADDRWSPLHCNFLCITLCEISQNHSFLQSLRHFPLENATSLYTREACVSFSFAMKRRLKKRRHEAC